MEKFVKESVMPQAVLEPTPAKRKSREAYMKHYIETG
jgi:hypothetical protein